MKHFHFSKLEGILRLKVSQCACFYSSFIRILRPITASSLNNFQFSSRKVLLFIHKEFFQIVHFCFIAISFWIYDHRTFQTQIKCLDIFCYLLSGRWPYKNHHQNFSACKNEHRTHCYRWWFGFNDMQCIRYYSLIKTTDQITHLFKGQKF